jgi:hypothetical protein
VFAHLKENNIRKGFLGSGSVISNQQLRRVW